jgi:Holliday junction resolvase
VKRLTNYFNSDNFLKGSLGIEIVKAMLEKSGYTVCHYGYEYTMLDALSKRTFKKSSSTTGRRIRSSPDLLVYDDKEVIMLVEVKTRTTSRWTRSGKVRINSDELEHLKDFWNDSILAIVIPEGIYAQRISELEIQQDGYQRLSDFKEFKDVFNRVKSEDISHYEEIATEIFEIFTTKKEPLEIEANIK